MVIGDVVTLSRAPFLYPPQSSICRPDDLGSVRTVHEYLHDTWRELDRQQSGWS
ncbi:hypothetical protein PISMIDRAFT_683980 [Pisolithus microcarpus 441]|uniref:Uncharacterized protein n=1 Tax=Pisolithus microcarpus 441 TaxID=765257 RepID=A0A0C9Y1R1_9AGAM|nr:hypothetical protein PISMIDRAFT_683980 [Pisolithus microcarpus 441]